MMRMAGCCEDERPARKHRHRTDGNGALVPRGGGGNHRNNRALCERAAVTISDNSQLTETKALEKRGQPAVVFNEIKPKVKPCWAGEADPQT